ncbi:MAG: S8 family serine peptidase, partial [Gemmataceae bacterium]|nr:S8 family serine peptidase [Gemmataceae bacterium]
AAVALAVAPAPGRPARPPEEDKIPGPPQPVQLDDLGPTAALAEATELVKAGKARSVFEVTGKGLTAAVLDTGLRATHVDFKGRVKAQVNFTPDNNGAADNAADGNGHGTNVTGIVAAGGPAAGGINTGMAPGAGVVAIKVLRDNPQLGGEWAWLIAGLDWVLDPANRQQHNITVVNVSISDHLTHPGDNFDPTSSRRKIRDRIALLRQARVPVVVAAGNGYGPSGQPGMGFPAICRETVSVGAVFDADWGAMGPYSHGGTALSTRADQIAPFSQRLHASHLSVDAATRTDFFAPGSPKQSSGIGGDDKPSLQEAGTSQASPVVAGVILLMQEYHLRKTGKLPAVDDLERWLQGGADTVVDVIPPPDQPYDNVPHSGLPYLRVNAWRAMTVMKATLDEQGAPAAASASGEVAKARAAAKKLLKDRK